MRLKRLKRLKLLKLAVRHKVCRVKSVNNRLRKRMRINNAVMTIRNVAKIAVNAIKLPTKIKVVKPISVLKRKPNKPMVNNGVNVITAIIVTTVITTKIAKIVVRPMQNVKSNAKTVNASSAIRITPLMLKHVTTNKQLIVPNRNVLIRLSQPRLIPVLMKTS